MAVPLVWFYSESPEFAAELATAARDIASAASGSARCVEVGGVRPGVPSPGGKVLLKVDPSAAGEPECVAEAIFRAWKSAGPSLVMIGATRKGREVAARLAVKAGMGCLSEVSSLTADDGGFTGERTAYAGRVVARVSARSPTVATVRVGAFEKLEGGGGDVEEVAVGDLSYKVKRTGSARKEAGGVDLKNAKLIVSAGRGVKKKEDLALIEGLASAMGGAVGCSRPLASDLGWLPEEHHIGLTGVNVRPDLYLAVGISGQLQHVAGIKDSKLIAAINTDKDAPIFQASDYGVVGDLYQVVPELTKLLSKRKG